MADIINTNQPNPEQTDPNVQAQAAQAVEDVIVVTAPLEGETVVVPVVAGQTVQFEGIDPETLRFTQDGGSLVANLPDGGQIVLQDFLFLTESTDLPPSLTFADGVFMSADDVYGRVENLEIADIAPAAGPGAGGGEGGASFTPYAPDALGEGIGVTDLLGPTGLQFSVPEPLQELHAIRGEEPLPVVSMVVYPYIPGEGPPDLPPDTIPENVEAQLGRRIAVLGKGGKTTLSKALALRLGIAFIEPR